MSVLRVAASVLRDGNDDCRTGYRCGERADVSNVDGEAVGICIPACRTDADCEAGLRCDPESGSCLTPGARAVGEACLHAAECSGAVCALGPGFVGGMCSARCDGTSPCPDGALCLAVAADPLCVRPCAPEHGRTDCRLDEGYVCRTVNGVSACLPGCRSHADCGAGTHCDPPTRPCAPGEPTGEPLGGPWTRSRAGGTATPSWGSPGASQDRPASRARPTAAWR